MQGVRGLKLTTGRRANIRSGSRSPSAVLPAFYNSKPFNNLSYTPALNEDTSGVDIESQKDYVVVPVGQDLTEFTLEQKFDLLTLITRESARLNSEVDRVLSSIISVQSDVGQRSDTSDSDGDEGLYKRKKRSK